MTVPAAEADRREKALQFCNEQIAWYVRMKQRSRTAYQVLQAASIVLGALTPVLILVTDLKLLQASVAAVLAIITGLLAAFRWRENYVRFTYTSEMLKLEKFRYETRTTEKYRPTVDDHTALENFVDEITKLTHREVAEWRQTLQAPAEGASQ